VRDSVYLLVTGPGLHAGVELLIDLLVGVSATVARIFILFLGVSGPELPHLFSIYRSSLVLLVTSRNTRFSLLHFNSNMIQ
jgi:hypothetical protein